MKQKRLESSQPGRQHRVKASDISLTEATKKEIETLKKRKIFLSDQDTPEIKNWDKAVIGKFYRPIKEQVTLRLDADVLDWFKNTADHYQTLINAACRDYMERHLK